MPTERGKTRNRIITKNIIGLNNIENVKLRIDKQKGLNDGKSEDEKKQHVRYNSEILN